MPIDPEPTPALAAAEAIAPPHPADPLLAGSELIREHWSEADAIGNRGRIAIYHTHLFKYPHLRVEESWSGKTGEMIARKVMVADHLLVEPREGLAPAVFLQRMSAAGFTLAETIGESSMRISFLHNIDDPAELPHRIIALGEIVEFAEPDYLVWPCLIPDDPAFNNSQLWGLRNLGNVSGFTAGSDIKALDAWAIRHDASSVIVSVTDTGIRYDHQDLAPNMWRNLAEIPGSGNDDDGNGVVDDIFGYNAYAGNGDPMDTQGHGTHCAGTIGARGNNGIGMTGVAWNVQLMACKFLGPFGGTTSDAIKVIDYSRLNGAHIINASWGGGGFSHALRNSIAACANAGIPFVAAAGNSGTDNDSQPHYPSSYDLPNIVAVAASNANDALTSFSCYGRNSVDLAAPGWQIWSTYSGNVADYRFLQGTSMAAPHVSGALALARAHYPDATVDELIDGLYQSTDKRLAFQGKVATGGRLNLYRLLTETEPVLAYDQFDAPYLLEGNYATWSGSNRAATREDDEDSYSPAPGGRTLWFSWQAPYDGFTTVSTSSLGAGQRIVIFEGQTRESLTVVFDSGAASTATAATRCHFQAGAGAHYRIVTASTSPLGELFSLSLEHVAANDLLSGASLLEGDEFEISSSNRGATAQPFETAAPHAGVGAGHSVWYRWSAPFSGTFTLNTEGSDTDTVLAVYTGDPLDPAGFATIGANDDVNALLRWSRVDFEAVEGTTYFIAVDTAMGGQPGSFVLRGAMPAAPVIASEPLDLEIPMGGRAVFNVGAEGTPPLRYQWFRNGEALPGAWANTLIIDPVAEDSLGEYQVIVTNTYGSTSSRITQLAEKRFAPEIIWSTGNIAVLLGQDAVLGVRTSGSEPMTYHWTKDGDPLIGEDQPSLQLGATTEASRGVYICTATNDQGSAQATMVLTVVTSPFDSFTAVRESAPNSSIASLSVIDGKCYAVASERIMVSEDGRAWIPWYLPGGFDGSALAKHDGKWYCAGFRVDGKFAMAISHDGVTWDEPVEITGFTHPYGGPSPVAKLVSINGRLVAAQTPVKSSGGMWQSAGIYHSTDGTNWTRSQRRRIDETLVDLSVMCRFEMWGGKLYAPGDGSVSTVLRSNDGITWQETALPVDGSGNGYMSGLAIGTFENSLKVVCLLGTYSTTDGTNWTMDGSYFDNEGYHGRQVVSTGGMAYSFSTWDALPSYRRGASTTSWSNFVANPPGQKFSAAVEFDGAIICGTTTGMLRRIAGPEDFTGTPEAVYPLFRVEFLNNEFIAYRPGANPNVNSPGSVLISGDARRWRSCKSFSSFADHQETNPVARVFLGGKYFSSASAGWIPAAISAADLPAGVAGARAVATDGTRWLVIASSNQVYSVSLDGSVWTPHVPTGMWVSLNPSLVHFNGKWFLCNRDGGTYNLYHSDDGIAWETVAGVGPRSIAVFNEKLYAIHSNGTTLHESEDGMTWSSFPTGIAPGTTRTTGGATTVTAKRLLVFDNKLITLVEVAENPAARNFAFFTEDARTWFRGNAPVSLRDLAVGNGMLVGVTSNGSVLVSGSTGSGGAAPLTNITYPAHKSTHVNGTMVEIRGTAVDPEGQAVTTECIVDGVSLGTTTSGQFRFQFRARNPGGHVVSVRSSDAAGIVGSDEIKVFASPPQLRNDFESAEGKTHLPQVAWTSFGGRAYAAGQYSLHRTRDDGTWEPVLLPSLPGVITNLVSGNGALIVQTSGATFVTRDGVVWTQLSEPRGGMIAFNNGWFTASLYDSYWGYTQTVYSQDGLAWSFGSRPFSSGTWSPSRPTVAPGGSLLVTPPYRSVDGGTNWIPMPELGTANALNLQYATAFGAVFAGFADGRVLRSTDDGRSWQPVAQFDPLPLGHHVRLALYAGRLFWGGGGYWRETSENGNTWRSITNEPLVSSHVVRSDGRFVGFGRSGMLWSANGHVWQPAKNGPQNPMRDMLAEDGAGLVLGDTNGGLWRASDGRTWHQVMPGRPATETASVNYIPSGGTSILMGNTQIVGGTVNDSTNNTFLWFTRNDGLDWQPCRFHGGPLALTKISNLWTSGGVAFAATSRFLAEGNTLNGLWRTIDGQDWHQLWSWPGGAVADMQFHNNSWWCLGTDGSLRRSTDHGDTWTSDIRPPGLLSGRIMIRFDGALIVIGTESANLQGPNVVHVTTDGQLWTKHAAPGSETTSSRLSWAATVNTLVLTSHTGRVFTATDRHLNWTRTATMSQIGSGVHLVELIGGKFCILSRLISDDGFTWVAPTRVGSFTFTPTLEFNGLFVTFPNSTSLAPYWSNDGLNWTLSTGVGHLGHRPVFAMTPNALRVRQSNGSIWETVDGKAWTMVRDGAPDLVNAGRATSIVTFGDRLLAAGSAGLLLRSDDDGRSWQAGLINGRQLPSSLNVRTPRTSPTEAFAICTVNASVDPPITRHFRSEDGHTWTELPEMAALNVLDYAWADGAWLAIRYDGSLLRSIDGGLEWETAGIIPDVKIAGRLVHYQGLWITACISSVPTGSAPIQIHTSPDGITWTHRADTGVSSNRSGDISLFFTGHGYLHYGSRPGFNSSGQLRSPDGIAWAPFDKSGEARDSSGATPSVMIPLVDGYLAIGSISSRSLYWTAPVIGGSWTAVPALQNQITWVGTPDGQRLFLFGQGIIKEWTTEDLDLMIEDPEPVVIGVGQQIAISTTLRNLGTAAMTDPIRIDAWLSTDRFFGDGNDVYVGSSTWAGPAPDPGDAATQSLSFTLPNTVRPGSHFLIVQLQLPASFRESNRANNVAITSTTVVTIPQRRLEVLAFGNGTVSSDQNAEYYPQGARIAMVATPGKGARFIGWGGDAVGSLGETLVIMDADKSVEANFISTAALTIFSRGGGSVQQSIDDGIYVTGNTAELIAIPLPGWEFSGWSGSLTGNGTTESLVMDSNKVVTARFSLGLESWKSQRFSAAELADSSISGDHADADGDGLANWREWLRGSDPKDRNQKGQGPMRREGNWIVMTYTRLENMPPGHEVRAAASFDLSDWSAALDERVIDSVDGVETIEARLHVAGRPGAFLRIRDVRPEP